MNKKIIFRGQSTETKEMIYGNLIYRISETPVPETNEDYKCAYIKTFDLDSVEYEVDINTIGQYTGLKDKNGIDIYEGDILAEGGNIIGSVIISPRYGISIKKNNSTWSLVNFCLDSDFDCGQLSSIEVIGNSYINS